jgi:Fur family peroxide stress response transcriptional regulator
MRSDSRRRVAPSPRELEELLPPYEQRLRAAGQFVTVQRRAILRFLLRHRTHPTTAAITHAVSSAQTASLATIYNNLALFAELGFVRAMRVDDGETHWDIRTDPHHHLRCSACGQVSDIECSAAEVVIHDAALAAETTQSQIWLSGRCAGCRQSA